MQQKDCIYIDDYRLIENNHYLINTKLKEDNQDISIEAICFLNDKFAKCKSAFTVLLSFNQIIISFSFGHTSTHTLYQYNTNP